jgi:plastocyanin domain-containing protein
MAFQTLKRAGCCIGLLAVALACSQPTTAQDGAIHMSVTTSGFEPSNIKAKKGVPLKLVITRKTDQTCAKEIVIDEYDIHAKLPLNTPVTVAFTPNKSGQLRYGCAMNKMVSGVLTIED